ncbi:sigma-E factor negative regulatory protein [Tamilnaduibacter salinus]|nr:sigma-E factor negative regulatory protein [Tamilnaduibacter salinus]PAV27190.1 anti-sigma factor [Tamilnaduibacter salinus]
MDDRLRETLSAMMDDEADELAVHRLLSSAQSEEAQERWRRWHQQREILRHGRSDFSSVDVRAGVNAALDGQAAPDDAGGDRNVVGAGESTRPTGVWPWVASLAVAVVIGFGAGFTWTSPSALGGATTATAASTVENTVPSVTLEDLEDEQRAQLNRYLLEHARNGDALGQGAFGYARVASVSAGR